MSKPIEHEFGEWFEAARHTQLEFSDSELDRIRGFTFVFVSGFHNEMMPLYFWGNIKELKRQGVPSRRIHRLHPSSHAKFETAVEWVAKSLTHVLENTRGQIVVIGHSRGACATLAAALAHADLFCDRVEALFLIQGPFGGTAIADFVVGRRDFPETWPRRRRGLARSLTTLQRFSLWMGRDAGLHDLTHDACRKFWGDTLARNRAEFGDQATRIERRSYFITSAIDPARSRFPRSELGYILEECDGPNDGVVALTDQALDGVGTRLDPLDAAHTDLVWGIYSTLSARHDRRALTQAMIRTLGDRDRERKRDDA